MNNDTIKFKHAADGTTSTCRGRTIFPAIWSIAAVDVSTSMKVSGNDRSYKCPTDQAGLEKLISHGNEFLEHANEANLALSMVMTDVENSEQINRNMSELAWLQAGLAELVTITTSSIHQMRHVLKTNNPD